MSVFNAHSGGRPEMPPATPGFETVNRYWDKRNQFYVAKILPGEYYVSCCGEVVTTVLGSCISACIRDTKFGIGGMNHFMLPHATDTNDKWLNTGVGMSTRYGTYAMEHMINDILKLGGMKRNLEVKIFGGGKVMKEMTDVGERNIAFIRDYLINEGLKITSEDVGNIYPRKVMYYPDSGRVRVKRLKHMHNDTILKRENSYMQNIEDVPVDSSVEIFD